jgi:hypothetical protein
MSIDDVTFVSSEVTPLQTNASAVESAAGNHHQLQILCS